MTCNYFAFLFNDVCMLSVDWYSRSFQQQYLGDIAWIYLYQCDYYLHYKQKLNIIEEWALSQVRICRPPLSFSPITWKMRNVLTLIEKLIFLFLFSWNFSVFVAWILIRSESGPIITIPILLEICLFLFRAATVFEEDGRGNWDTTFYSNSYSSCHHLGQAFSQPRLFILDVFILVLWPIYWFVVSPEILFVCSNGTYFNTQYC